jgi:hypothetical protein
VSVDSDQPDGAAPRAAPGNETPRTLRFEDRAGFDNAVLALIRRARGSLLLVDRDFSSWPIESSEGEAALREALRSGVRLRLLVRQPEWLARHGARFARLQRTWSDRIACRALPETLRVLDSLAVADRRHAVIRRPPDSVRGLVLTDTPGDAAAAAERSESVWEESEPCLPATTLGL